jgi:hypothetical protein
LVLNCSQSDKYTSPQKNYEEYSVFSRKFLNPEEEENKERWEEDTNDTELMKNINSLLDAGKLSKKSSKLK